MRSRLCVLLLSALFVLFFSSTAPAEICKVKFDVFTQNDVNNPTPGSLRFNIEISDNTGLRPPDAVDWTKPFTVTIPTTPTLKVYSVKTKDWEEWSDCFHPILTAASIGGTIPTGTYKLTLTDKKGRTFTLTNTLASSTLLPAAVIDVWPTTTTPNKLAWSKPSGALFYRIRLKDKGWGEPVYWYPKTKDVYIPSGTPSFTFPTGVLRSGHTYQVQIEARDNDKDLGRRSRSLWKEFTIP